MGTVSSGGRGTGALRGGESLGRREERATPRALFWGQGDDGIVTETVARELEQDPGEDPETGLLTPPIQGTLKTKRRVCGRGPNTCCWTQWETQALGRRGSRDRAFRTLALQGERSVETARSKAHAHPEKGRPGPGGVGPNCRARGLRGASCTPRSQKQGRGGRQGEAPDTLSSDQRGS